MVFVTEVRSEDTGGGFQCDVLVLADNTVLIVGEDSVVLYSSLEAWEQNLVPDGQVGAIVRPSG